VALHHKKRTSRQEYFWLGGGLPEEPRAQEGHDRRHAELVLPGLRGAVRYNGDS
jgi:hypothetical protein